MTEESSIVGCALFRSTPVKVPSSCYITRKSAFILSCVIAGRMVRNCRRGGCRRGNGLLDTCHWQGICHGGRAGGSRQRAQSRRWISWQTRFDDLRHKHSESIGNSVKACRLFLFGFCIQPPNLFPVHFLSSTFASPVGSFKSGGSYYTFKLYFLGWWEEVPYEWNKTGVNKYLLSSSVCCSLNFNFVITIYSRNVKLTNLLL